MSYRRKQSETHREVRSPLYKQRVERLRTAYKRRSKHRMRPDLG